MTYVCIFITFKRKICMMKIIRTVLFSSICFSLAGQKLFAQGANLNNNNVVGWNNPPSSLVRENVSYSDVKGDCYWNPQWLRARVTTKNGEVYNIPKAKLNLYSEEIHYINDDGLERALKNGVSTVVFYSRVDTSKIGVFKSIKGLPVPDKDSDIKVKEVYTQVLAEGKIRFLKLTIIKLIQREGDAMTRTLEWNFEPRESYFIEENYNIQPLGSINKEHLFALVKKADGDEEWLKLNKNKLKKEIDVIAFLNYKNSLAK